MREGVTSVDVKVRYAETDQMGIAYYGHYVVWFEVGRTHYMETCGLPYREIEERGVILPVSETYYRLIAPATTATMSSAPPKGTKIGAAGPGDRLLS